MEYIDTFALGWQGVFSCAETQVPKTTGLSNMPGSMTIASTKLHSA